MGNSTGSIAAEGGSYSSAWIYW